MATAQSPRFFALLQREFREYRNSLFWTPVITAIVLGVLMLLSVVVANRIAVVGDTILDALMSEERGSLSVSFSVGEDGDEEITVMHVTGADEDLNALEDIAVDITSVDAQGSEERKRTIVRFGDSPVPDAPEAPTAPRELSYELVVEENAEENWNFSREWTFNPESANGVAGDSDVDEDMDGSELNVMLSVVHAILLMLLLITSVNYLLSSLYDDRKDRSILFWRSMPVGEWEVVLSKFAMALIMAPMIYIAISLLLQLAYVLLMMLLVWRMDQDPMTVVLQNIDFVALMVDPISGWLMTALLIAPTYAWLLLASALARRSPLLMAVTPLIVLLLAEGIFFGTERIEDAVQNHVPHISETSAVGFYLFGPQWSTDSINSMVGGLIFAALALTATVWLRRHRWEID